MAALRLGLGQGERNRDRMNIFQRTRAALNLIARPNVFFGGGNSPRAIQRKEHPFDWPAWRVDTPQWQTINYETFVHEGFNINSLVYSAIMYKARTGKLAPL